MSRPDTTTRTGGHCDGCDDHQPTTRTYRVRFRGRDAPEPVRYCAPCADLARVDFSGTVDWIEDPADVLFGRMVGKFERDGLSADEACRIAHNSLHLEG